MTAIDEQRTSTLGRAAAAAVIIALLAMWVWIFLFAPRDNPDRFETPDYALAAEPICAAAQAEINALPAGHTVATPQQRAVHVRRGTEITVAMIDELQALMRLVESEKDRQTLERWFEDWEDGYITDRWRHVEKLELADADTPPRDLAFTIQERVSGGFYTRRIDGLANVNDMASCHVPLDI